MWIVVDLFGIILQRLWYIDPPSEGFSRYWNPSYARSLHVLWFSRWYFRHNPRRILVHSLCIRSCKYQSKYLHSLSNLARTITHILRSVFCACIGCIHSQSERVMRAHTPTIFDSWMLFLQVVCAHELYKRTKVTAMSFADVVAVSFSHGPEWCKGFANIARMGVLINLFVTYFGTCSVYSVLIAENFQQVSICLVF